MIYLTGSGGLIGSRFREVYDRKITRVSYRDKVKNVFKSHKNSCLIHLGWSSTTRTDNDELDKVRKDISNSQKLFDYYSEKNPNGKIIFVSTAGDMHLDSNCNNVVYESSDPNPRTLYGETKLFVENILKGIDCNSIVLRATNIWGGVVDENRVNGLVDKLINALNTDHVTKIYADLDTHVDLIHIDDFINLLIKVIDNDLEKKHELFLVGGQSISIGDIINKVSKHGSLNLKIHQKVDKSYITIGSTKAMDTFNWTPEHYL